MQSKPKSTDLIKSGQYFDLKRFENNYFVWVVKCNILEQKRGTTGESYQ